MGKEYSGRIQLASKGVFYEGALKENDGYIDVEPWGTSEERLLQSPSIDFHECLDRLIKRCTNCPIDPGELILEDRWHLFLYMRCLSYGGEYQFTYKCSECGSREVHEMNLEKDLDVVYSDDQHLLLELSTDVIQEPFEFSLPIQDKVIKWRKLRGKDEKAVEKYVSRMKSGSRRKVPRGEDPGYEYRLALRIVGIGDNDDPTVLDSMELIQSLKGRDALTFRQEISSINIGVKEELHPTCESCGWENEVIMPMDKSFFRIER